MEVLASVEEIDFPVRRVLLFRIGQLGDSVVALPSLLALRKTFPEAQISWLADRHLGSNFVSSEALLNGLGLVDFFYFYPVKKTSRQRLLWVWSMLKLVRRLRLKKFDLVLRLDPEKHGRKGAERDTRFFNLCGIKSQLTVSQFRPESPLHSSVRPLPEQIHEVNFYQGALEQLGLKTVSPGEGFDVLRNPIGEEQALIDTILSSGDSYVGVGVGSKMPSKRWEESRFEELLLRLYHEKDKTPVFFGGSEDSEAASRVIRKLRVGIDLCGYVSLRGSVYALSKCEFYVGNDTGTMHLAVAAGIPCVAIFSARDVPGKWYPFGKGHEMLRIPVDCEGCMLERCLKFDNQCLKAIKVNDVFAASCRVLNRK